MNFDPVFSLKGEHVYAHWTSLSGMPYRNYKPQILIHNVCYPSGIYVHVGRSRSNVSLNYYERHVQDVKRSLRPPPPTLPVT